MLGFFALRGVLTDIEVPTAGGTVDGEIRIDERPILVEVTFTSQELLPSQPGVHAVHPDPLVKHVIDKIRKTVAAGRQLATAGDVPAILVLGRNHFGADGVTAKWGIQECFAYPDFSGLSGVVVPESLRVSHG